MAHAVRHADEVEAQRGVFKAMRQELGASAFGVNQLQLGSGAEGPEHDHSADGQEEVYVIVRGSGTYVIDGEEVPIREGDVFRFDPETTRGPKAGPDGLTMLAVGAPRGSYEPRGSF